MRPADLGLNLTMKRTRKREFLAQMERVMPWAALVALITPYSPEGRRGRLPFAMQTKLRIHFVFALSVHTVRGTAGSVNDVVDANTLLQGKEIQAGCQGAGKRPDAKEGVRWNIAMRLGKRLDKTALVEHLTDQLERVKTSIRAKVEHPFRVNKRQFDRVKVRHRGRGKNTAQLHTLFALFSLWMVRRTLMGAQA